MRGLKVVYLGGNADLSEQVLRRLVLAGVRLMRVVVPAPTLVHQGDFPAPLRQPNLLVAACEALDLPQVTVSDTDQTGLYEILSGLQPDLIFSVCCPVILAAEVLQVPLQGAYNLHPSLLPAYRGPMPLFWQFRAGEQCMGITLHHMTRDIDGGAIVSQRSVSVAVDTSAAGVTKVLAEHGAHLLTALVRNPASARVCDRPPVSKRGSYFPWPQHKDFRLCLHWSAERAYRFMIGTASLGMPYLLEVDNVSWMLNRALSFDPDGVQDRRLLCDRESVRIQFAPGILCAHGAKRS